MKKLTFKDVCPRFICSGYDPEKGLNGLEVRVVDGKPQFNPESKPTKQEREAIKLKLKGHRILFKEANTKGFFERAGSMVHGNVNSHLEKYNKLCNAAGSEGLIMIGRGDPFTVQSYVDGSYTINFK